MTIYHLLRAILLVFLAWQVANLQPLLWRPLCEASEGHSSEPLPPLPSVIQQKRGHPRQVDTDNHYCPNKECRLWLGGAAFGPMAILQQAQDAA